MVNIFDFLRIRGDILVLDANGGPLMLVYVQAGRPNNEWIRQGALESLQGARLPLPYVMLVDRETIQILRWDGEKLSEPVCQIPTVKTLRHYAPDFGEKRISHHYLSAFIGSWLRDFAYGKGPEPPPGYEQLALIGLAERLREATPLTEPAEAA